MVELEKTLQYAAERSPYYRQLFGGRVPAFTNVPTTDKKILSERTADFLCVPSEKLAEIVTTSGTTGAPIIYRLTAADLDRLAENERQSFECAGLSAADTVVLAVTLDRGFIAGLAYWLGLQKLGCRVVRVGPTPALITALVEQLHPTAIVAVPSTLRLLTGLTVAKAICIGEPVRNRDFSLNAAGQAIATGWNAQVFSTYGVTELASSLCECPAGNGGHLHEDLLHLEILDDAGQRVPDGEVGEVVATPFGVEAMPLLRYRTGDCAAVFREPCACGRTSLRLGPIVGRKNQKLKFRGTTLFPSALQGVLETTAGVDTFVIIARRQDELSDAVEVVVHGSVADPALRDALQGRAKCAPQIRHAPREEIEALQMPANARKRRYFVDLR
ncbi:MAG: Phenylacetate-coenzyme A ligase [Verrucomicrobiae bacterium]|nr:Phenylacetate-coenzyme A ligase [Verrucomicrobiae bacterium]